MRQEISKIKGYSVLLGLYISLIMTRCVTHGVELVPGHTADVAPTGQLTGVGPEAVKVRPHVTDHADLLISQFCALAVNV